MSAWLSAVACSSSDPASPPFPSPETVVPVPDGAADDATRDGAPDLKPSGPPAVLDSLSVSTGDLNPPFSPTVLDYSVTSLNSLVAIDVTASATSGLVVTINGAPATSTVPSSLQLKPNQDITVNVASTYGASKTYTVHYLPPNFLHYYTQGSLSPPLAGSESVLLTPQNGWLFIVDRAGSPTGAPLYYRVPPTATGTTPAIVTDFRRQTFAAGHHGYSYALENDGIHLMDDHFRETGTLSVLANRDHGALPADIHDFLVLGDQHYLLLGQAPKVIDLSSMNSMWSAQAKVITAVIQEVDHGAVTFEWNSDDDPGLFADSVFSNAFTDAVASDYVHADSLQIDPLDGNIIVSLRHTSSILKINRTTGATMWTLGGKSDDFGLTAGQRTAFQHHANKQSDGTLLVFDNGALGVPGDHPTRVVAYVLDETAKTVIGFREVWKRRSTQPDTTSMGSAFLMSADRYLIGWGSRSDMSVSWPAVSEIVSGVEVWSISFNDPTVASYRAHPMQN